ncbi:MAG: prepilin peptidase [Dehalococcoidia bacterium]
MLQLIAIGFAVPVGLGIGSFLNVVIDRVPSGQSLLWPPSHCPNCQRRIPTVDLVPVMSYLWLRGRCRFCRSSIPGRIPLVEAGAAALFALVVFFLGFTPTSLVLAATACLFLVLFIIDLERQIIPNSLVLPGTLAVFLLFPLGVGDEWGIGEAYLRALAGIGMGFGVMLAIYLIARGGMGAGDVKLGALVGAAIGFPYVLPTLVIAFLLGGVTGIALLALRLRGRKDAVPFGPYLAGAALAALFFGGTLQGWYSDLVLG